MRWPLLLFHSWSGPPDRASRHHRPSPWSNAQSRLLYEIPVDRSERALPPSGQNRRLTVQRRRTLVSHLARARATHFGTGSVHSLTH